MATDGNDAGLWLGICQRLAPVFTELFQKRPGIGPLAFIDTETGCMEDGDIIELGAISVGPSPTDPMDVRMECFWELICPGESGVSPFSTKIHGITPEMLKRRGRPPKEAFQGFVEWVEWVSPRHLVAHSAKFDKGMLEVALSKHGVDYCLPEFLCTVAMAKGLPVENRKLGTLARYFGYENQQAHRSITDAEVCAYIFAKMSLMGVAQAQRKPPRRRK
jgi:DNA polymerase-3 subunit epsilon